MRYLRIGCAIAALIAPTAALHAQDTSASIRGQVTTEAGDGVANAIVVITHTPSGTRTTQTTDANGNFNASGLRLGGPYTVNVAATGFDAASDTIASLQAGTPQRIGVIMAEAGQTLVVTASRQKSAISIASGPATVLSADDIRGISTVNRDIRNLAVRNPLVSLDPTNGGAISIAGQNNRFNRISVDGIQFGDPFGLEAGGLASARGPVPLDAIGEFSVEIAPVDIQQGGFQGGAINTQLKSGGNDFTSQGFYTYSSDSLAGNTTRGVTRPRNFESQIYGAQLTGPIIKDKLFFAVTFERLRDTTPSNVLAVDLGIAQSQIDQVNTIADSRFRFDAGDVAANIPENDDKLVAKIDWNIADGHRAAFTYIYNKGDLLAGQTGTNEINNTNPTLSLLSNNYTQGSTNHYGVFQLNDQWSDSFSTQVRVSYNDYVRLQVPFGDRSFGQFQVCLQPNATLGASNPACPTAATNGGAAIRRIQFGPDVSRQANELSAQTLGIEFQAQLKMNNHTVKFIAERRAQDFNNLFAQNVSGNFRFDSIADLSAGRANQLVFAAPIRGGIDTVRALFANNVYTVGLQDVWDVNDTLTLTAGFRWDLYETPDEPVFNADFLARSGFPNNGTLNGRQVFQPRVAAAWKASDRLSVRATAGLFAGGNPNVWISNNYSNPGPTLGSATVARNAAGLFAITGVNTTGVDVQALGAATLNNVTGGTGVPAQLTQLIQAGGSAAAPTNVLDPNFQIPSQWRVSGTIDYAADLGFLGDDWNFGADVVWSRVKNALTYTDLRSVPNTAPGGALTPDGRQRYQAFNAAAGSNTDLLLTNTDRGYSWNAVVRVDKEWENGFRIGAAYTFQRSKDVNSGTSSTAGSNYGNAAAGIDPNNGAFGTSNYQIDDAYRLTMGYEKALFGDNKTRIELFFNSRAGQRFSYTFADTTNNAATANRSAVFGTVQNNTRYLIYVPNVASATADPLVQYAPGFDFAGFQRVVQSTELNKFQGSIAPKNIGRSPRFNKLDISIRQELPFVLGGKMEVFADMENVLNFIDRDWGSLRQVAFPYFGTLVNVSCVPSAGSSVVNTTPGLPCAQYRYSNRTGSTVTEPNQTLFQNQSLWQIRVGARVKF